MSETFDELFNNFFGKKNNKKPKIKKKDNDKTISNNDITDKFHDFMKFFTNPDAMSSFPSFKEFEQNFLNELDNLNFNPANGNIPTISGSMSLDDLTKFNESLGEPDKIEIYHENGLTFERKTYKTDKGDFVIVNVLPFNIKNNANIEKPDNTPPTEEKLQALLDKAVKSEKYEEAAAIFKELTKLKDKNKSK